MSTVGERVFWHINNAQRSTSLALGCVDAQTEYLRDELEKLNLQLQTLLDKMARDEALTRDREYLHSDQSVEGVGEWIGGSDGDGS